VKTLLFLIDFYKVLVKKPFCKAAVTITKLFEVEAWELSELVCLDLVVALQEMIHGSD
jgi:hypothetical protein